MLTIKSLLTAAIVSGFCYGTALVMDACFVSPATIHAVLVK